MKSNKPNIQALFEAIKKTPNGTQNELAQILSSYGAKIGQPSIAHWIKRERIPARWGILIEEHFGTPTRYELCPHEFKKPTLGQRQQKDLKDEVA